MAKLLELCSCSVQNEKAKRMFSKAVMFVSQCNTMEKRCEHLRNLDGERMFLDCKTARPGKKYRNTVSSEQAGRMGAQLRTARWGNSYITNVYRHTGM